MASAKEIGLCVRFDGLAREDAAMLLVLPQRTQRQIREEVEAFAQRAGASHLSPLVQGFFHEAILDQILGPCG